MSLESTMKDILQLASTQYRATFADICAQLIVGFHEWRVE